MWWQWAIPAAISAGTSLASMFTGKGSDDDSDDYAELIAAAEAERRQRELQMVDTIMGKRQYKLDEKAMKRVVDQMNQMRATGQNITPEMYDSLYRAELQTAADTATKRAVMAGNIGLKMAGLSEEGRQFDENNILAERKFQFSKDQAEDQGEAAGLAGIGDLGGQLSMLALMKNKIGAGAASSGANGSCILVTACHGADSDEVKVAREFRDRFLDEETIRGYYVTAEFICPAMQCSKRFLEMVKSALVDSLIEYGRYILGEIPLCSEQSKEDTLGFLGVCKDIGHSIPMLIRQSGEVV